ncbi:unnamed protein product [Toxocara canis]|uniref:Uncharacterized protein n=1 Tax=Toxocara canis TaxID=6265 RepID=A0A183USJ3_TOXCA|nr:unnamed protein product [Toxocara canis]
MNEGWHFFELLEAFHLVRSGIAQCGRVQVIDRNNENVQTNTVLVEALRLSVSDLWNLGNAGVNLDDELVDEEQALMPFEMMQICRAEAEENLNSVLSGNLNSEFGSSVSEFGNLNSFSIER